MFCFLLTNKLKEMRENTPTIALHITDYTLKPARTHVISGKCKLYCNIISTGGWVAENGSGLNLNGTCGLFGSICALEGWSR